MSTLETRGAGTILWLSSFEFALETQTLGRTKWLMVEATTAEGGGTALRADALVGNVGDVALCAYA